MSSTLPAVMGLLPARPRLLALGEPTHGEDVLLDLRNDLFRQLVEQEGYRTIAIESDCMMGLVVDDYVTSGTGTLDEVMERGFSHEWGAFAANRELVRWMRAYNDGRPASRAAALRRFRRPAGDHRRREPSAGPHRTARLPHRPGRRRPASLHRGNARPPARRRRPVDRSRRDDGPVPVRGADARGRTAAAARRRPGGPARRADATPDRGVLAGRLGPGTPVRPHRHRPAALPLLDGRHVTEPHGAAAGRCGTR